MSRLSFLFTMLLSLNLFSDNINIFLHDNSAQKEYLFIMDQPQLSFEGYQLHQELLAPKPAANSRRLDFKVMNTIIDGQIITRSSPIIDGIAVEGADGIYSPGSNANFYYSYFDLPEGHFNLNAAEALEKAISYHDSTYLTDPYVEKIEGSYEQIWLMHFGELRPAYKTRPPTLSLIDLQDIYIDAETGAILKIEPSAQFASAPKDSLQAPASLFVYSPAPDLLRKSDLKQVMLKDLVSIKENDFLRGKYVSVRNCCHFYTCPEEGPCNDDTKRCALKSHPNALQSSEIIQLPTNSLGLDPLMTLPKTISVNAARCTYLPFAKASYQGSNGSILGFFEEPIDEPFGLASEMDRFSEVQAYNSVTTFFNHIRFLLNNPKWCLRENAMSCDADGNPVVDSNENPTNPYRVFVNQMVPDMKMSTPNNTDPESFLAQILAGRGTKEKPIELKTLTRMGNAAFVPALSTLKQNTPRADEILSDLIKPYDHNVFFQGDRDFAYDGDVVFHEFMHAVTTSMVNKLNTLGINEWAIHSDPGSLNEGWSDYFAAAFSNRPAIGSYAAIRGGFGEASLRDIDNNLTCPNDVIGEIHNDGLVWSGALWEIRKGVIQKINEDAAIEFDRAVLSALAQAKTTEDFKTQSEKLLKSIRERSTLGPVIATFAQEVLQKRGVANCHRAYPLSSVDKNNNVEFYPKDTLMVPSKNQIGLNNYAPSSSQLFIAIPAGARSVTVSWRQYLGGTGALLGTETTPDKISNTLPLGVMGSFDEPINWHFNNKLAHPHRNDGPIQVDPPKAIFDNGRWHYSQALDLDNCEQRNLYLSLLSNDYKYILRDIRVDFQLPDKNTQSHCHFSYYQPGNQNNASPSCSSSSTLDLRWCFIIILALLRFFKLRRDLATSRF
jgi:hypothetical protein